MGSAAAARVEGLVARNLKPQRWALGLRVAVAGSAPVRCHGLLILFGFTGSEAEAVEVKGLRENEATYAPILLNLSLRLSNQPWSTTLKCTVSISTPKSQIYVSGIPGLQQYTE